MRAASVNQAYGGERQGAAGRPMNSWWGYGLLIAGAACGRLVEAQISWRNARACLERGGREFGQRRQHVLLHAIGAAFIAGCLAEPLLARRPFVPALAGPMLVLVLFAQMVRWWSVHTLGPRWCSRVIAVPGTQRIRRGPYRWCRHPAYLAAFVEGFALPLIHTAWATAAAYTLLHGALLALFIRQEEAALQDTAPRPLQLVVNNSTPVEAAVPAEEVVPRRKKEPDHHLPERW